MLYIALPNALVPILNNYALKYSSAAEATILVYTMPALTSILVMLNDKKFNPISFIAGILCILGVFVFTTKKIFSIGEVIILISALFWTIGTWLPKKLALSVNLYTKVFFQILIW